MQATTHERLSRKALNRALLARQMLVTREPVPASTVIERLVGLQAQQARPPFVGLWSRSVGFERQELRSLIESRAVVRGSLMRCTLHLMTRRDFLAFRPVLQPALTRGMQSILGTRQARLNFHALLAAAREALSEQPRTFTEVRAALSARFPDVDARVMGFAVRMLLPLLIVPAEHAWGYRADPSFTLAEEWLDAQLAADTRPHPLVLRYLAAFGPASARDITVWSGLAGMAAVMEELRPQLIVFRDEQNRELFDLPEAPRPPEETPVAARYVADFDNLILSHADRARIITDEHRKVVVTKNGLVLPTVLVDGFVAGTWKVSRTHKTATLTVSPFSSLPADARDQLADDGERLARFVEPGAEQFAVRFE
ncbi:MAG: winged helix DNA-binding domain-containing protein [Actinomycetota bacterium]